MYWNESGIFIVLGFICLLLFKVFYCIDWIDFFKEIGCIVNNFFNIVNENCLNCNCFIMLV